MTPAAGIKVQLVKWGNSQAVRLPKPILEDRKSTRLNSSHRDLHSFPTRRSSDLLSEIRGENDASSGNQSATREVGKQPSGTTPQTDIGAGPHQRRRSIGCQRRGRKNSIAENYPEINVGISFVEGHSRESPSRNELGKTSR